MTITSKHIIYIGSIMLAAMSGYVLAGLTVRSITTLTLSDFHVYYYVPKSVLYLVRAEHPYTNFVPIYPYFFPPGSILLFGLIAKFNYFNAKLIWTIFNIALLLYSLYLVNKLFFKHIGIYFWILLFFSITYYPFQFTLKDGQFNIVMLFIYSFSLYTLMKSKPVYTGITLGLGSITKISPILIVIYLFWLKKYKIVIYAFLTILVFSILAEYFIKPGINLYYLRHVVSNVSDQASGPTWRDQSILQFYKQLHYMIPDKITIMSKFSVLQKNVFKAASYLTVGFILIVFAFVDKKVKKSKYDTVISYSVLSIIGVLGTGLAWYHQYTMLLLGIWVAVIVCFKFIKSPYNYIYGGVVSVSYLLCAINLENKLDGLYNMHMLYGGLLLMVVLFIFKVDKKLYSNNVNKVEVTDIDNSLVRKFIVLVFFCSLIINVNPFLISEKVRVGRDNARIKAIDYIGNTLTEFRPKYKVGSANSFNHTHKLDEGYILFDKGEDNKVRKKLSILYIDPINNEEYNYSFMSKDGKEFTLGAKLESNLYIQKYGNYYYY